MVQMDVLVGDSRRTNGCVCVLVVNCEGEESKRECWWLIVRGKRTNWCLCVGGK